MTESSPSAETIRFVIEILSARPTPVAELPQTIAGIAQALARLGAAPGHRLAEPTRLVAALRPERKMLQRLPVSAKPPRPAARLRPEPADTPLVAAAPPKPSQPPIAAVARRRGRPRRVDVVAFVVETPAPDVPPPQPRLLRRAEALAYEAEHHVESQPVFRTPAGTLRGVVKWFDGRTGKGAMRLAGISGDVLLDPATLANSGIKRLYKDQEIEATVEESNGRVRLLSLSLPARNGEPSPNAMSVEITGTLRRQPRSVQVEIKRDGIRQSAARAEAEQVLGGVGRIKVTRRLTP